MNSCLVLLVYLNASTILFSHFYNHFGHTFSCRLITIRWSSRPQVWKKKIKSFLEKFMSMRSRCHSVKQLETCICIIKIFQMNMPKNIEFFVQLSGELVMIPESKYYWYMLPFVANFDSDMVCNYNSDNARKAARDSHQLCTIFVVLWHAMYFFACHIWFFCYEKLGFINEIRWFENYRL
jgi:hypothetical protein